MLTTFDDDELLSAALRAGAAGFQLKDAPGEEIVRAVRAVADGEAWLDPGVTGRVLARRIEAPRPLGPQPELEHLTPRELEVLQLIGRGTSRTRRSRPSCSSAR